MKMNRVVFTGLMLSFIFNAEDATAANKSDTLAFDLSLFAKTTQATLVIQKGAEKIASFDVDCKAGTALTMAPFGYGYLKMYNMSVRVTGTDTAHNQSWQRVKDGPAFRVTNSMQTPYGNMDVNEVCNGATAVRVDRVISAAYGMLEL